MWLLFSSVWEQTLIDILLAFTGRNDMIKKDKKP